MKNISDFNRDETTVFLKKLLDIRESGMEIMVPQKYREYLSQPTPRKPHYALTRRLIQYPLLPPSPFLSEEMKELAAQQRQADADRQSRLDSVGQQNSLILDTSFWPVALSVNRGASCLYRWEHILYRTVLDDYLRNLEALFFECDLYLKNFENALKYISSLHFFTVPIRFWLGPDGEIPPGIYANESILMDYVQTSHPLLWDRMLDSQGDPRDFVNSINPQVIEEEIGNYVKIDDDQERKIVHDPDYEIDKSFDESNDERYPIYWWFPDSISSFLDEVVRENKTTTNEDNFEDLE